MNFYSYSSIYGMQNHPTSQEAKFNAEAAMRIMSADRVQYSNDDITAITWGEITERAAATGEVGYALRRQDRLSYEAANPQVKNGKMTNSQGDDIQLKNIKKKDLVEHDMVLSIACIWLPLSAMLARFKLHTFEDITTFAQLLFDSYGVTKGGSEGNMSFYTYDRKFKLIVGVQKTIGFGPELQIARQKLLDAVESYPPEADDLKTIVLATFFPIDGQIQVAKVLQLRTYNVNNPMWKEGMAIIDDSIKVVSSKKQIRFYMRDNPGDEYTAVPLHIAAL